MTLISSMCLYLVCLVLGAMTVQVLRNVATRISLTTGIVFHIICIFTIPGLFGWLRDTADFTNMLDVAAGGFACGYMGNIAICTVIYALEIIRFI